MPAILLLFVAANGVLALAYRGRALPYTTLGVHDISNTSLHTAAALPEHTVLPAEVTLVKGADRLTRSPEALGVRADVAASLHAAPAWRRWIPLLNLAVHEHIPLQIHLDTSTVNQTIPGLAAAFTKPASAGHIIFSGSSFTLAAAEDGYRFDSAAYRRILPAALKLAQTTITIPTTPLAGPPDTHNLAAALRMLQAQADTAVQFMYAGQSIRPAKGEIGRWFVAAGATMQISSTAIRAYLQATAQHLNITIANPDDLAAATAFAVTNRSPRTFAITAAGAETVTRTYCTAVRGVDPAVLDALTGMLAATYNDARGWNDGGHIAFEHADRGCQYTVWLSAASQMGSFGAICDDYYNCQIGDNVVLNYDRWQTATNPWNATHGSLEDYRTLMIDHETGHRLGFRDNPTCPGTGQPAPVMMQQSIALKGCIFNVWPRLSELTQLDQALDLPTPATGSSE